MENWIFFTDFMQNNIVIVVSNCDFDFEQTFFVKGQLQ